MAKCYFEVRTRLARGIDSITADAMRHLKTRQHLGKAVVLCERNHDMLGPGRKQWLKLARSIQRERAGTLNADKILKYTHTITRMQHMRFSYRSPLDDPEAEVHFLTPQTADVMPVHCYTVYITDQITVAQATELLIQLPPEALIVDYRQDIPWKTLGLQPKATLEHNVVSAWRQLQAFLERHAIDTKLLTPRDGLQDIEALDNALDTLLNVSHGFLRVANDFQRALELARPLRLNRTTREAYDLVILLGHRVQALSPGAWSQRFLESYSEDDTFFMYDPNTGRIRLTQPLAVLVAHHSAAGRHTIVRVLRELFR